MVVSREVAFSGCSDDKVDLLGVDLDGCRPPRRLWICWPLIGIVLEGTLFMKKTFVPIVQFHFLIRHKEVRFSFPLLRFTPVVVMNALDDFIK